MSHASANAWLRTGILLSTLILGGCAATPREVRIEPLPPGPEPQASSLSFDDTDPGTLPACWNIAQTNPTTSMAVWEVIADDSAPSAPNVLALTKTDN